MVPRTEDDGVEDEEEGGGINQRSFQLVGRVDVEMRIGGRTVGESSEGTNYGLNS